MVEQELDTTKFLTRKEIGAKLGIGYDKLSKIIKDLFPRKTARERLSPKEVKQIKDKYC